MSSALRRYRAIPCSAVQKQRSQSQIRTQFCKHELIMKRETTRVMCVYPVLCAFLADATLA